MTVESAERNAAYVAARATVATIGTATRRWPPDVARWARRAAYNALASIIDALGRHPTSAARRTSLRGALCNVLELAAICDVAMAHGLRDAQVEEALRCASRTLSMLGMSFHATATCID
jgi:hypothetical protein